MLLAIAMLIAAGGCSEKIGSIQSISIDYPHGETRLVVQKNGEALLYYGALPRHQKIKNGSFDVDALYKQLRPMLHSNVPREEWPDPKSVAGMVIIRHDNNIQSEHLVFDAEEFTERLFNEARNNAHSSATQTVQPE